MPSLPSLALLALATCYVHFTAAQASGSGTTTRYWDCCKGSCAWPGKADVSAPVKTCNINDQPLSDPNAQSGCNGGSAYTCSDQSPWAVSDTLAYGFAAVSIPGGSESSWCCACYELTFTSTSIAGKRMIVQATNTGADLAQGQFDLAIPGGGVGIYNGCTDEWGAPASGWGAQYGGISSNTCSSFPQALQPGCNFRFGDFFEGADNPTVDYREVTCPKVLTDKTGCIRSGETPSGGGFSAAPEPSTSAAAPASPSKPADTSSKEAPPPFSVPAGPSSSAVVPAPSSSEAAPASSSAFLSMYPTPGSVGPASSSMYASSQPHSTFSYLPSASASSAAEPVNSSAASSAPAPSSSAPGDGCEVEYIYV